MVIPVSRGRFHSPFLARRPGHPIAQGALLALPARSELYRPAKAMHFVDDAFDAEMNDLRQAIIARGDDFRRRTPPVVFASGCEEIAHRIGGSR